jgi:hypothetical protein
MRFSSVEPSELSGEELDGGDFAVFVVCSEAMTTKRPAIAARFAAVGLKAVGAVGPGAGDMEFQFDSAIVELGVEALFGLPTVSFETPPAEALEEFLDIYALECRGSPSAVCYLVGAKRELEALEPTMSRY